MKIAVVGLGYVGLSNAILLAQENEVIALDISMSKVDMVNDKKSPILDTEISEYLEKGELNLVATTNHNYAIENSNYVIICTPTDYDPETNFFDTSSVEETIEQTLSINPDTSIVIKSTVPVGFTKSMRQKLSFENITFSPEFLREGKALYDNLYPSRIVMGSKSESAKGLAELMVKGAKKDNISVIYTDSTEAEAVKLFANTFLAMRVAFFNELDSFAEIRDLNTKQIIEGISLDPRIGDHYNNPSFGYGGYCLPKDTKQLLSNYRDVPNNIMSAVVEANQTRKFHISDMILKREPKKVGIYRLAMKTGSDNFRESAIQGVIEILIHRNVEVVIHEPLHTEEKFKGLTNIRDFNFFAESCDVIIANRFSQELQEYKSKIYTRDIFSRD